VSVINPVISHTTISQPGLPTFLAMSALTMKIPEPIIDPATIMVESNSPNDCLKDDCCSVMQVAVMVSVGNNQHGKYSFL
jgi:hypothetical protein